MTELDLIKDQKHISILILWIYRVTKFSHVVYKGKPYYERSNPWNSGESPEVRPEYDTDVQCVDYDDVEDFLMPGEEPPVCPGRIAELTPGGPGDVKYHIPIDRSYKESLNLSDYKFSLDGESPPTILGDMTDEAILLLTRLHGTLPSRIKVVGPKVLVLQNTSTVAGGKHRGTNHCKVALDFSARWSVSLPCTLSDLIEAAYRIKRHKWDICYELYAGAEVVHSDNNIVQVAVDYEYSPEP